MFDYNRSDMQAADSSKINEIAVYMNQIRRSRSGSTAPWIRAAATRATRT